MAVHEVGGQSVEVTAKSTYYWFYRRQGISVKVSPRRHWWCLWLCSSTTEIDAIRCTAVLSGVVADYEATGSCTECGSLSIMGPSFWGGSVSQAYQQARYEGNVTIDGQSHSISGSITFS